MNVLCPAKLNLFLSVGPIDHRGYHPIRTIFQAISLYDEMFIERSDQIEFACDDPSVPADNTVVKAIRLMQEIADFPPVRVKLTKRIPSQAGLGGGSSDAAGVILASKHLMLGALPEYERNAVAKSIGADVPFFLLGGRARGEGYGEKLTKLPSPDPVQWYVVAQPEDRCNTGEAYAQLDQQTYDWRPFPTEDELYNDFERVAPCGSLDLLDRLKVHGATGAGLTGSGSAVFGVFTDQTAAEKAASKMANEAPFAVACHSL